jgi:hypothetical protein
MAHKHCFVLLRIPFI